MTILVNFYFSQGIKLFNLLKLNYLISFVLLFAVPVNALAERATIAVASNFNGAMAALVDSFEQITEHEIVVSYGSSGRLYAQIINGAPYDLFLSADEAKPSALITENYALDPPVIYAQGQLVLWSNLADIEVRDEKILASADVKKVAMANPRLAPYGLATEQALKQLNFFFALQSKLVLGESVSQSFQFTHTGNAQVGFVAYSQLLSKAEFRETSYWLLPSHLHDPINQAAVLLKRGAANEAAIGFLEFLQSVPAKELLMNFGYTQP